MTSCPRWTGWPSPPRTFRAAATATSRARSLVRSRRRCRRVGRRGPGRRPRRGRGDADAPVPRRPRPRAPLPRRDAGVPGPGGPHDAGPGRVGRALPHPRPGRRPALDRGRARSAAGRRAGRRPLPGRRAGGAARASGPYARHRGRGVAGCGYDGGARLRRRAESRPPDRRGRGSGGRRARAAPRSPPGRARAGADRARRQRVAGPLRAHAVPRPRHAGTARTAAAGRPPEALGRAPRRRGVERAGGAVRGCGGGPATDAERGDHERRRARLPRVRGGRVRLLGAASPRRRRPGGRAGLRPVASTSGRSRIPRPGPRGDPQPRRGRVARLLRPRHTRSPSPCRTTSRRSGSGRSRGSPRAGRRTDDHRPRRRHRLPAFPRGHHRDRRPRRRRAQHGGPHPAGRRRRTSRVRDTPPPRPARGPRRGLPRGPAGVGAAAGPTCDGRLRADPRRGAAAHDGCGRLRRGAGPHHRAAAPHRARCRARRRRPRSPGWS